MVATIGAIGIGAVGAAVGVGQLDRAAVLARARATRRVGDGQLRDVEEVGAVHRRVVRALELARVGEARAHERLQAGD